MSVLKKRYLNTFTKKNLYGFFEIQNSNKDNLFKKTQNFLSIYFLVKLYYNFDCHTFFYVHNVKKINICSECLNFFGVMRYLCVHERDTISSFFVCYINI